MRQLTSQRCLGAAGGILVAAYASTLAWAFESQSYNIWGSMLIAPLIGAINAILIWRVGRVEEDRWIVGLMGVGLVLKMVGSFARYFTVFVLYNGVGDAAGFNNQAALYHQFWRHGQFIWETTGKLGTRNLEIVTTAVYTIIGPAPLAGFLVFASFAFWGAYFCYRGFRVAVPDGQHRVYAALLLLMPSLLFWPSSIGKESWLLLWVGVFALGVAKFFRAEVAALPLILLGTAGTVIIRPHLTVLLVASVLGAQAFRPVQDQAMGVLRKAMGILALVAATVLLVSQAADSLGIDDLSARSLADSIDWASGQTQQGGSSFTPVPLSNPLGVPAAIITILFRPFVWEANGPTMLLQSAEGLVLILLFVSQHARLRRLPLMLRTNPFVTFTVLYAVAFTLAFAGFGNFGILARQRTLMLPFALVMLALPNQVEMSQLLGVPKRGSLVVN